MMPCCCESCSHHVQDEISTSFCFSPVSHLGIFKALDEDPSLLSGAVPGRR